MSSTVFNPLLCDDIPNYNPGFWDFDENGKAWIYLQADLGIDQFDCVRVLQGGHALAITETNAAFGERVAVMAIPLLVNQYGWGQIYGDMRVNVLASCAINTELRTTSTAGTLDDATGGSTDGISSMTITTVGGSVTSVRPGHMSWPVVKS